MIPRAYTLFIVKSIVLVNPDPVARELLAQLLRARGTQVYCVASVAAAIATATQTELCAAVIEPELLSKEAADLRKRLRRDPAIFSIFHGAASLGLPAIQSLARHGATMLLNPGDDASFDASLIFKVIWSLTARGGEDDFGAQAEHLLPAGSLVAEGEGPRVLVVDDEPAFRGFVCDALAAENFQVWASTDGLKALTFLQSHDVDLVVSDVNMEGMDGITLALQLCLSKNSPPPFIIISADAGVENVMSANAAGVVAFISKPISSLEDFYASVSRALGRAR